jgi:hypothetical protein
MGVGFCFGVVPLMPDCARKPVQCGRRVGIDTFGDRAYSQNSFSVPVSGLTHPGMFNGGAYVPLI